METLEKEEEPKNVTINQNSTDREMVNIKITYQDFHKYLFTVDLCHKARFAEIFVYLCIYIFRDHSVTLFKYGKLSKGNMNCVNFNYFDITEFDSKTSVGVQERK